MQAAHGHNDEQAKIWNGAAGRAWVDEQGLLDRVFAPFEALLVEAASARDARSVLDVGCGAGATSLAIARDMARRLGRGGSCVGADISEPLIDAARARAAREHSAARFVLADAQTHAFEPAAFDLIVSRFGVMFFGDPVAAFANLRRAASHDATLCLIVFRTAAENAFMTTAERAAAPFLPDLPPRKADAPGQFAFADRARVQAILEGGGWAKVELAPLEVTCAFPVADLDRYLTRLGPVGLVLQQADEATRTRVLEVVRAAFEPFIEGAEVRFRAACWALSATAGAV